jgi:3-oxoacyl-[acyl-carrier-protein] synthase II
VTDRIAVTGMAAWGCFGRGLPALIAALRKGTRTLGVLDRLPDSPWMKTRLAMVVPELRHALDPWPEAVRVAMDLAAEAAADAGLAGSDRSVRTAVVNGTMHGTEGQLEFARQRMAGNAPDPELLAESAAGTARAIARRLDARGPVVTVSTACSSGLNAIGQAARLVQSGEVHRAIAGGNDLVSVLTHAGFNSLAALSPSGCRPLDVDRDGITLGDGAAYVVLEREEDARRRGARSRGVVTGYAFAGEGYHATASDPDGVCAIRVLSAALAEDGAASELALVFAHATGTLANDANEVRAIQEVVRRASAPGPVDVCAMKSRFGHTLGAAGAIEAVAALACIGESFVPGTAALSRPVPHQPPLRIGGAIERTIPLALCSAFGFGGSIAALALRSSTGPG